MSKQLHAASVLGNKVQSRRAEIKRLVRAREMSLSDALRIPEPATDRMPVRDLLRAAPGLGQTKTERALRAADLEQAHFLGGLDYAQRALLAKVVTDKYPKAAG